MDYISYPLTTSIPPIEVPYVSTIAYDFLGFEDFPTRHGFVKDGHFNLTNRSVDEITAFIQAWLYFGLLSELAGTPLDMSKYIYSSGPKSDKKIVRVANHLPRLIGEWTGRLYSLDKNHRKFVAESLCSCVAAATASYQELDRGQGVDDPVKGAVLLSVKILIITLRDELRSVWGLDLDASLVPLGSNPDILSASSNLLISRMTALGWCPHQIHRVCSSYDYSVVYYLSNIDRRKAGSESSIHQDCSETNCVASNVEMTNYLTRHTTPSCKCRFIEAPVTEIVDIISRGGIPLASVRNGPHGSIKIHVEQATSTSKYSAISHVWADGLGNPNSNALPHCQLQWLVHCLERLPPAGDQGIYLANTIISLDSSAISNAVGSKPQRSPPCFWMDTLCIPVEPKYEALRLAAINKMAPAYAQASQTLVLDSELQQIRISTSQYSEILAKLAYSAWMGRCWTLQEGAISRACYFQFADGALNPDGLSMGSFIFAFISTSATSNPLVILRSLYRSLQRTLQHWAWHKSLRKRYNPGHGMAQKQLNATLLDELQTSRKGLENRNVEGLIEADQQILRFVSIWNALTARSTTKADDIYAILANLLDYNANQIMALPADERIKAILWSLEGLPFSILYNTGARLRSSEHHRERWVPIQPRGHTLNRGHIMRFTDEGLCLNPGNETPPELMLSKAKAMPQYCFVENHHDDKIFFVKTLRDTNDQFDPTQYLAICIVFQHRDAEFFKKNGRKSAGACLYLSRCKDEADSPDPKGESGKTVSTESNFGLHNDMTCLYTVYDCPLEIWEVKEKHCIPPSESEACKVLYTGDTCPVIKAESLRGEFKLILECDTPRLQEPFPRRPYPTSPSLLGFHLGIALILFIVFMITPAVLLIILTVQASGHVTTLGIAALVMYCLGWAWFLPPSHIFREPGIILFIVDRVLTNRFNLLTKWCVALWATAWVPSIFFIVGWHFSLRDYAYRAWLATFDEDWLEQRNKRYKLWWIIFAFDAKLKAWAERQVKAGKSKLPLLEQWMSGRKIKEDGDGVADKNKNDMIKQQMQNRKERDSQIILNFIRNEEELL